MDDPELALEQHLERLDDDDEQEFVSSPSDSEVNGPVESSVEMNSVYGPTVNKEQQAYQEQAYQEQAYSIYRHAHVLMQPAINPRANSLQHSVSGSEDNSSIASFESDAGAKSAIYSHQNRNSNAPARLTVSDTEGSRHHHRKSSRRVHHDAYLTEGKTVSREEFALRIRERLMAVAKDRDAMTIKARDLLRQRGLSYEEIMSAEWFMLPEARKYLDTDDTSPVPASNGALQPPSSHHLLSPLELRSPDPNAAGQLATPQGIPSIRGDVGNAIRDWHLTNQQMQNQMQRKRQSHSRHQTSGCSSVFSATSDSGVGGDSWATNDLTPPASTDRLHAYVRRQNVIASRLPERDRTAQAAAIALISNSPQPDSLSPLPGHAHHDTDRHPRRHVGHYSSGDDSSSVFTITSQSSTSDLFIPRRAQHHPLYAPDSDEQQQHYSNRNRRPLTTPKSSRSSHMKNHAPSPLAEQHRQIPMQQNHPRPANRGPDAASLNTLIMYTLGELTTPFAKRLSGSDLTLKDFKERVFARKGDYRFFFKNFCPDVNMELYEELSDDMALLPLVDGKIVGRVEKLPVD